MATLGSYLKQQRLKEERSLRWVERLSKKKYPNTPERQITNGYLFQLEEDKIGNPHPVKLKTLAEIYMCDYFVLLELAGYLEANDSASKMDATLVRKFNSLNENMQKHVIKIIEEIANSSKE